MSQRCLVQVPAAFLTIVTVVAAVTSVSSVARAQENLGTLEVSSLYLEPTFTYNESDESSFDIGRSFLGVTWTKEPLLSATIKIGNKSLIGIPARYGAPPVDEFGLIEGYAQIDPNIGQIRAGLVPIMFSLEGGDTEERLRFPRSLLFSNRIVNLRDYGLSYHMGHNGMFSDWSIHNGEGGTDLDNKMWFTLRAGYQAGRRFKIGISGSTGSTSPTSTNPENLPAPANSAEAGYDVTRSAQIRLANFFTTFAFGKVNFLFETTGGDITQDGASGNVGGGHFDLEWESSDKYSWLARYDQFDPTSSGGDKITEAMLGWAWKSVYENSVLYVFAAKRHLEGESSDDHRAFLIWRITPVANSFNSPL